MTELPLAWSAFRRRVKEDLDRLWMCRWASMSTCRQTRDFVPVHDPRLTAFILSKNRAQASRLVQFYTGHNHLLYHQSNTGQSPTDLCRLCGLARETSRHLWSECEATARYRWETSLLTGWMGQYRRVLDFIDQHDRLFRHLEEELDGED